MSGSPSIPVTLGQTLQMSLVFTNIDGSPIDLSQYQILSQVCALDGSFVDTLAVNWWSDQSNQAQVQQGTDGWPAGFLLCDILLVQIGTEIATYSDQFLFLASAPVTLRTTPALPPV